MRLRELKKDDAIGMLEWMHDKDVTRDMQKNFSEFTISDCLDFIDNSDKDKKSMHFAIVNDQDDYMGTVSLKNIDAGIAEFAITIRKCAMGKGYSRFAMSEILKIAFCNLNIKFVYWYVLDNNKRALKFYDKMSFQRLNFVKLQELNRIISSNKEIANSNYIWYGVSEEEYYQRT